MPSSIAFLPTQRLSAYVDDAPAPLIQSAPQRLVFTGSGSEYFRIWIVNLLLNLLTLGIYSAWAKVRKTRYFYDNTQLDGSSFEYHGQPAAILKGRSSPPCCCLPTMPAAKYPLWQGCSSWPALVECCLG